MYFSPNKTVQLYRITPRDLPQMSRAKYKRRRHVFARNPMMTPPICLARRQACRCYNDFDFRLYLTLYIIVITSNAIWPPVPEVGLNLKILFGLECSVTERLFFTDLLACNLMVWPSSLEILPYSVTQSVLPILGDVLKSNWLSLTPSFWGFWIEIINFLFSRPSF